MEKNREKAWDQSYVTDRKWWTRLVQTKSTIAHVREEQQQNDANDEV